MVTRDFARLGLEFVLVLALVIALGSPAFAAIEGAWMGSLKLPNGELRIVFHIAQGSHSSLSATMDSPDQGAKGIPVDEVIWGNSHLHLGLKAIDGAFDGDQKAEDGPIEGNWTQGGVSFPITLSLTDSVPQLRRPQEPKPPFPYDVEEVSYPNSKASVTLAGTLTLPRSGGKSPAVLLITGSGPQDRDEAILGHRPFFVLADYLTRRGIAVLRVDDRGVGKSTGDRTSGTTADFADDALVGIEYLRGRKDIDSKLVGLIGHSEGGIIAPMVASKSKHVAFIVMMAGTGLPGEEILYLQAALIAKAGRASDSAVAAGRKQQEAIFTVLKQETDTVVVKTKLRAIIAVAMADETPSGNPDTAMTAKAIDMEIQQVTSPWFRYFLTYDPRLALKKVKCPVLAINGEKDLQVPPMQNLPEIESALKEGGNKHLAFEILPGLNHLFQTAQTGSPEEYAKIEETMSPLALSMIGDWIQSVTGRGKN